MDELDRAASALFHLAPDCGNDRWVKIGMAAKSAGLSFDDFHLWSSSAGNYAGERDCRSRWNSFSETGGVTANTLFALAFAEGWKDPSKALQAANGQRTAIAIPAPRKAPVTLLKQSGKAAEVWAQCLPVDAHEYIQRKQGLPDGLRVYPSDGPLCIRGESVAGCLVVPCYAPDGTLQTLQFIPGQGAKLNLPGASFGNGYFTVGDVAASSRVFIVEGIGQAWAAWKATGCAAVVCFGAGRMATVAQTLREQYPNAKLVILPDRGKEPQAEAIARAVNGEWCELPHDMAQNDDANDYMLQHGAEALSELLEHRKAPSLPEARFKLLTRDELEALPPLKWSIRGVFPEAGLAAIYGPSASGKSFLSFDMAAAIAEGQDWFGLRVKQAPVVYAALEGEAGFRMRAAAWEKHRGRRLPQQLAMMLQPFKLTEPGDVQDLAAVIPAGAVVFIDTLNRAAPTADENSSKDMGEILDAAKRLQAMTGGLVVLVHHTGKDSSKGLRGHSSLFAALDAAVEVSRDGERREWRVAKSKDGQDGNAHPFRLQIEPLGEDEHGDAITSCVVVRDTATDEIKRVKRPQGANQVLVAEALRPLFISGTTGKSGAPPSRPCIELERAVTAGAASLTCPSDKRTSRAREAITGMVKAGYLGCNEGWLWVW